MILTVRPLRFEFRPLDPVSFPAGAAANVFRGAFGDLLRRISCTPDCREAKSCPRASECAYARIFEPRAGGRLAVPSGFQDLPRPFVLRAASLDGRRFEPGEAFSLDVNLFDPELAALELFGRAFALLGTEGLGPGRPRVELLAARQLPAVTVDFLAPRPEIRRVGLEFLTPTELKAGGETLREPRFDALLARARDRVSALVGFYQPGETADLVDYRGLGERAAGVRMTAGRFELVRYERRSSKTGQRHGLGGFTGEAEYEGDLTAFLPWLEALWWTGVGRLTVWGNGLVRVRKAEI